MIEPVYVDLVSGCLVGITPRPVFWTLFEQAQVKHPRVLLMSYETAKRRPATHEPPFQWWRRGE